MAVVPVAWKKIRSPAQLAPDPMGMACFGGGYLDCIRHQRIHVAYMEIDPSAPIERALHFLLCHFHSQTGDGCL